MRSRTRGSLLHPKLGQRIGLKHSLSRLMARGSAFYLPDIRRILKALPAQRQTLFFSATMPKDIRKLADRISDDPTTVQIGMIAPVETVSHALYLVSRGFKKKLLLAMLQQTAAGRVLIFTRTKHRARGLARDLEKHNYRVSALQGNMSQNQRQKAIDGFRDASTTFSSPPTSPRVASMSQRSRM